MPKSPLHPRLERTLEQPRVHERRPPRCPALVLEPVRDARQGRLGRHPRITEGVHLLALQEPAEELLGGLHGAPEKVEVGRRAVQHPALEHVDHRVADRVGDLLAMELPEDLHHMVLRLEDLRDVTCRAGPRVGVGQVNDAEVQCGHFEGSWVRERSACGA